MPTQMPDHRMLKLGEVVKADDERYKFVKRRGEVG